MTNCKLLRTVVKASLVKDQVLALLAKIISLNGIKAGLQVSQFCHLTAFPVILLPEQSQKRSRSGSHYPGSQCAHHQTLTLDMKTLKPPDRVFLPAPAQWLKWSLYLSLFPLLWSLLPCQSVCSLFLDLSPSDIAPSGKASKSLAA